MSPAFFLANASVSNIFFLLFSVIDNDASNKNIVFFVVKFFLYIFAY